MGHFQSDECLEHHGIMGMKWGVRRFQNADGTLTPKGKARMAKVSNSKLLSKIDTNQAKGVFRLNAHRYSGGSEYESKKSEKLKNKANEALRKSKESEPGSKRETRLKNKAKDYEIASKEAAKRSKEYLKIAEESNKKLKDIESGTLKAGRDFIVQMDMDYYLTTFGYHHNLSKELYKDQSANRYVDGNGYFGYTTVTQVIENKKK